MRALISTVIKKREYILLFYTAFLFFFLEVVFFAGLRLTTFYFQAQLVIALSLLGLIIGGIFATYIEEESLQKFLKKATFFLPLAPLLGFGGIVFAFSYFWLSMALFGFAFAPIGFLIGLLYRLLDPWHTYAVELLGGATGLVVALLLIPPVREENVIFLAVVASVVFFVVYYRHALKGYVKVFTLLLSFVVVIAISINLNYGYINFINIAHCRLPAEEKVLIRKTICFKTAGYNYTILRSLGSVVDRLDVLSLQTGNGILIGTSFSGAQADILQPFPPSAYRADARIPSELFRDKKELSALIIGAGAEGVVKAVKAAGIHNIIAVDINPAIIQLWNDEELRTYARDPFADVDLVRADGRAYLETTSETFDLITMMNTHRTRDVSEFGQPDFLHTKEAFQSVWDHLSDDGFFVFEEPNFSPVAAVAIERITATLREALKSEGIARPEDHIALYEWSSAVTPSSADSRVYVQFVVKKTPLNDNDFDALRSFAYESSRTDNRTMPINILFKRWLWIPLEDMNMDNNSSHLAGIIAGTSSSTASILTDMNPFPVSATLSHNTILVHALLLFGSVFLLAFFWWHVQTRAAQVRERRYLPIYFILIGLGYMFVEIALIQWLQLYLGSVLVSFLVAIGGLLTASALGSIVMKTKPLPSTHTMYGLLFTLFGIFTLGLLLLPMFFFTAFSARLLLALLFTVGIGAGLSIFFPYGVSRARSCFKKNVPLLVGLNGSAMALGVPLSFLIISESGFIALLLSAGILYLLAVFYLYES